MPNPPARPTRKINLTSTMGADTWEVDAPADVEVHRLISKFIRIPEFGFKATDDAGNPIPYRIMWTEANRFLNESETLDQAQVQDGHTLAMTHEARAG